MALFYTFLYISVEVLAEIVNSFPQFNEHFYDCSFELFIRKIAYLYFIITFCGVLSCSFWDIFLHSLTLFGSLFFIVLHRSAMTPGLENSGVMGPVMPRSTNLMFTRTQVFVVAELWL